VPLDDCASCGEMFYSDDLYGGVCVGCQVGMCREPDGSVWPEFLTDRELCPCCGRGTAQLIVMTHRNGRSREVCPDCEARLRNADRDAWRWFHHGSLVRS
jgi:hypothetical protein